MLSFILVTTWAVYRFNCFWALMPGDCTYVNCLFIFLILPVEQRHNQKPHHYCVFICKTGLILRDFHRESKWFINAHAQTFWLQQKPNFVGRCLNKTRSKWNTPLNACNSISWSRTRQCAERCFSPQSKRCLSRPLAEVWKASAGSAGCPSPSPQTGDGAWVLVDVKTKWSEFSSHFNVSCYI